MLHSLDTWSRSSINQIFIRKTLRIEDAEGQLIALYVSHAQKILQRKLAIIIAQIQALFPGELYSVDSSSEDNFKFLALHFAYYFKYSENVCFIFILIKHILIPLRGLVLPPTFIQISSCERVHGESILRRESLGSPSTYVITQPYIALLRTSLRIFLRSYMKM